MDPGAQFETRYNRCVFERTVKRLCNFELNHFNFFYENTTSLKIMSISFKRLYVKVVKCFESSRSVFHVLSVLFWTVTVIYCRPLQSLFVPSHVCISYLLSRTRYTSSVVYFVCVRHWHGPRYEQTSTTGTVGVRIGEFPSLTTFLFYLQPSTERGVIVSFIHFFLLTSRCKLKLNVSPFDPSIDFRQS